MDELAKRVEVNPRYSLRSFSQFLGIAPGSLSEILRGERSPSDRNIDRFFSKLELNEAERKHFLVSLLGEKKVSGNQRISKKLKMKVRQSVFDKNTQVAGELGLDQFRIIADWYHLAIWEMVERPDFKAKSSWIAKRLGISRLEAKLAFERLKSQEMIENVNGHWLKTEMRVQTKDLTKTSDFHRRRQKQILDKAKEAVDTVPIEKRQHSGITINIDPDRLPEVKEKIQSLLWGLAAELEQGNPRQIYEIALQVFPLEKPNAGEFSETR